MTGTLESLLMGVGARAKACYCRWLIRSAEFDLEMLREDEVLLPIRIAQLQSDIADLYARGLGLQRAIADPQDHSDLGDAEPYASTLAEDPGPLEVRVDWNGDRTIILRVVLCDRAGDVVQTLACAPTSLLNDALRDPNARATPAPAPTRPDPPVATESFANVFVRMAETQAAAAAALKAPTLTVVRTDRKP